MLKTSARTAFALALAAGAALAAPTFAAGATAPSPAAADGATPFAGPQHRQPHDRFRGGPRRPGGPMLHGLRELDLSAAQKDSIRSAMRSAHEAQRDARQGLQTLHRQWLTTAPDAPSYNALTRQLADAEADAARDRVQRRAALQAQIHAMLTDAQKAQLAERLAALPEPGARSDKSGWRPR